LSSKDKILSQAIVLFAEYGYSGLSMRMLAKEVKLSVAAIYHHFPDKNTLYLEAVRFAFSGKELAFEQVWESECPPTEKLAKFIRTLIDVMLQDRNFQRLMQREILEANPDRMQLLAQGVFKKQFNLLMQFISELAPEFNAYLVSNSIIGLVKNYLDHQPLHRHFPGWQPEYDQADVIAQHITELLLRGLNK
jgi:AcrR family transcriptional regulator